MDYRPIHYCGLCVMTGEGVSIESDEDCSVTWTDWTNGRETEGKSFDEVIVLLECLSNMYDNYLLVWLWRVWGDGTRREGEMSETIRSD